MNRTELLPKKDIKITVNVESELDLFIRSVAESEKSSYKNVLNAMLRFAKQKGF